MRQPADSKATGSDGEAPRLAFRPDIEGLRAIAVLAVLGYHAGVHWMAGGFVGVDVFFVISGFLITGILISQAEVTGSVRLGHFYAKRARRPPARATVGPCPNAAEAWTAESLVETSHQSAGAEQQNLVNGKRHTYEPSRSEPGATRTGEGGTS